MASLDDLKQRLEDNIEELAVYLLGEPSSKKPREWRWGARGSLKVNTAGPNRGKFFDFEMGTGGDAIGLICHTQRCDFSASIMWARDWLGDADLPLRGSRERPNRAEAEAEAKAKEDQDIATVRGLWNEGVNIEGTPGETYLRSRAITPSRWPSALRWHASGYLMLATTPPTGGEITSIHRIYVSRDGVPKRNRKGGKSKYSLGPRQNGAVRLEGDEAGPLCLAEGPETGLSIWYATRYETWCALGSIGSIDLSGVPLERIIIIAREDDARDAPSRKALRDQIRLWKREGRTVLEAPPWILSRGKNRTTTTPCKSSGRNMSGSALRPPTWRVRPQRRA